MASLDSPVVDGNAGRSRSCSRYRAMISTAREATRRNSSGGTERRSIADPPWRLGTIEALPAYCHGAGRGLLNGKEGQQRDVEAAQGEDHRRAHPPGDRRVDGRELL